MDRTVCLNDNWYVSEGRKGVSSLKRRFTKGVFLPAEKNQEYTVTRKFICPKQINDTVTVFFTGEFPEMEVYADKKKLEGIKDPEGRTVYDVTQTLSRGHIIISATVKCGRIDGFYFSVKRKV